MLRRDPEGPRRPYVVAHVAVSLDGATTGFDADVGRYYALARTWDENITLTGADTILAQEAALAAAPRPGPKPGAPVLAVVDARRRVREWDALRDCGYWSDVVALRADPASAGDAPVAEIVTGGDRVDLAAALGRLAKHNGTRVVRVDGGGALLGALLSEGLVDEVSLLVHPCLAGDRGADRWYGREQLPALRLSLVAAESFEDGLVWLRYRSATEDLPGLGRHL